MMNSMLGVSALLALCLMVGPWRCAADCDANIENKIKAQHRDPMEFNGIYETLSGEYEIVLMSSGENIANGHAKRCLRMEFSTKDGEFTLAYKDTVNGNFIVTFKDGSLITRERDDKSVVSHRIVYLKAGVVAFYACSNAGNDPPLSVVAVSSPLTWFADRERQMVDARIQEAKAALEQVGVRGFATVPYCNGVTTSNNAK